jgi:hypothetical protein
MINEAEYKGKKPAFWINSSRLPNERYLKLLWIYFGANGGRRIQIGEYETLALRSTLPNS